MADAEEKAKAEKLAAARKRVEQMKKKKKGSTKKEDRTEASTDTKPEEAADPPTDAPPDNDTKEDAAEESRDAEEAAPEETTSSHQRTPSLSVQSKMRSSSFRQGTGGPLSPNSFSPDGDTAPEIYRKQALRIEELEKELKKASKEAADGERRYRKAEDELEKIMEEDSPTKASHEPSENIEKLRNQISALERQNTQLQAQTTRSTRHGSSPSVSVHPPADFEAILASKSSTIESMEIEISNLRAALERAASGSSEKEQILALEDKLQRSEKAAALSQRKLGDLKKNLDRTTEKAVKEGSERISAETKLRTRERESEEAKSHSDELEKKVDALEKKVATLATLHKEHDARFQTQKREREKAEKESSDLRARLAGIENENLRLKEERERARKRDAQGVDDEGVDELENEERQRLEKKVRELEGEVHELRRGIWRDRRKEMDGEDGLGATSPGAKFTDVDLGGAMSMSTGRRGSAAGRAAGGIGDFFTSGFNAITGANAMPGADGPLLEDDELLDFDEDAFRLAQEEEVKRRIERVKEVKRSLKNWEGWRLDLLENGSSGGGPIFEV